MKYTKQYFIDKFNAIPSNKIGAGSLHQCCALAHCGVKSLGISDMTEESIALSNLLRQSINVGEWAKKDDVTLVFYVNDSIRSTIEPKFTPKDRILFALKGVPDEIEEQKES